MALTDAEVSEIALLARLHLEPDERARMAHELTAILEHFQVLAAVETTGVPAMTHPVELGSPLRADTVAPSLTTRDALAGVPHREGNSIVVPAIIPGSE